MEGKTSSQKKSWLVSEKTECRTGGVWQERYGIRMHLLFLTVCSGDMKQNREFVLSTCFLGSTGRSVPVSYSSLRVDKPQRCSMMGASYPLVECVRCHILLPSDPLCSLWASAF